MTIFFIFLPLVARCFGQENQSAPSIEFSTIWRQPDFTTGKSPEENFDEWNARISWGFDDGLVSIDGDWLEIYYPAGSLAHTGGIGLYASPIDLAGKRTVRLDYNLMFADGFDFVKGGKLPGLYGGHSHCSGGSDSEDCFSTRFMWRREGDGEVYAYIPNEQVDGFCDEPDVHCNYDYGHSLGRGAWRFEVGVDHLISQTVSLNTPGNMDGSVTVMLNGNEVYRREQLNIRQSSEVDLLGIMLQSFYGGSDSSWAPSYDTYTYFRNFSLSSPAPSPTSTSAPGPTSQPPEQPECINYRVLDDSTRKVKYTTDIWCCDSQDTAREEHCDDEDWKGPGWYRIAGSAGTRMPSSAPGEWLCGTGAPGWVEGQLPSRVGDKVDSRVCFRYEDDHCQWEADIQITACTGFLVYYLPNTPECTLRYCGAD